MNKAALSDFWYKKHNKVLAIFFCVLGLGFLFAYYTVLEIGAGWDYFRSDFGEVWNLLIYLVSFGLILYGNIRNDQIAYTGILMFVFFEAFDAGYSIITLTSPIFSSIASGSLPWVFAAYYVIEWLALAGLVFFGLFWYIRSNQYMRRTFYNFKAIRGFGIAFVSCLVVQVVLGMVMEVFMSNGSWLLFIIYALPLCFASIGVSCLFTMERLRRD